MDKAQTENSVKTERFKIEIPWSQWRADQRKTCMTPSTRACTRNSYQPPQEKIAKAKMRPLIIHKARNKSTLLWWNPRYGTQEGNLLGKHHATYDCKDLLKVFHDLAILAFKRAGITKGLAILVS